MPAGAGASALATETGGFSHDSLVTIAIGLAAFAAIVGSIAIIFTVILVGCQKAGNGRVSVRRPSKVIRRDSDPDPDESPGGRESDADQQQGGDTDDDAASKERSETGAVIGIAPRSNFSRPHDLDSISAVATGPSAALTKSSSKQRPSPTGSSPLSRARQALQAQRANARGNARADAPTPADSRADARDTVRQSQMAWLRANEDDQEVDSGAGALAPLG